LGVLLAVDVSYVTLPGWQLPITLITSYEALPLNCRKYIDFIEEFLGVPIEWIGVGPERDSMVRKERKLLLK
jgi:adenylosuccinate synthase